MTASSLKENKMKTELKMAMGTVAVIGLFFAAFASSMF